MRAKSGIFKLISIFSAMCLIFSAAGTQMFATLVPAAETFGKYGDIAGIERDFSAYFYDNATANIGSSAVLISDAEVNKLENYNKYISGAYTSLADYLFSVDDSGNLLRDTDYGTYGNRKTGFLFYRESMTDFEISFDYRFTPANDNSWKGIYVGFGAERKGEIWANDTEGKDNFAILLQPADHNALCGSTSVISELKAANVNYGAAADKYSADRNAWFSFILRVENGNAEWYIDGDKIAEYAAGAKGGYIYFGTMSAETAFRNISVTDMSDGYKDFSEIEDYFTGAFYDDAVTNLNADSVLQTDETISELENYDRYISGGYTSLADYLFSIDADGNLFREIDTGVSGDKKIGFLYYNEYLTDFTVSFEYRHNMKTSGVGRRSVYIGFGMQEIGNHHLSDSMSAAVRLQPKEMYFYSGAELRTNYSSDQAFKDAVISQYENDLDNSQSSWYTFTLTVSGGKAVWEINGAAYEAELDEYIGGYIYITAMTRDTAFRNIKVTPIENGTDTSAYTVTYVPYGKKIIDDGVKAQNTDFDNCWSLDDGVFTRTGSGDYAAGPSGRSGESHLYFSDRRYDAFTLELDYSFGGTASTWKWAAVGFGADSTASNYAQSDGYIAFVEQEGYISYNYYSEDLTKYGGRLRNSENEEYMNIVKGSEDASWHHLKITVQSGTLSVSYDDVPSVSTTVTDYAGYVYIACFTPGMQFKNVSITELSDKQDDWADSYSTYYMPNGTDVREATNSFTACEPGKVWTHTDGMIVRSGSGEYEGGPNGVKGEAALYFKEEYRNFVLEYDYSFAGATATWKWAAAGFGAESPGQHFASDGSWLAFIEQEGYRSYWENGKSGRISGLLPDYEALVKGEDGDTTWHHFTLVVKGDQMEIYLDNYDVASVTLQDYSGGYVYIMSNTPGMSFRNIEISEILYITEIGEPESIIAETGTPAAELSFPQEISVSLSDGRKISLGVSGWQCDSYNPDAAGNYIFTGTLDLTGTGIYEKDSGRFVKIAVTLADYDTNYVKDYVITSSAQLDSIFSSYYIGRDVSISKTEHSFTATPPSNVWQVTNQGGIKRGGVGDYDGSESGHKGAATLYFPDKINEFELDFDYCFNGTTTGHKWITVGVGAQQPGKTSYDKDGGTLMCVEQEGQIRLLASEESPLITSKSAFSGYYESLTDKSVSLTKWHHIKVAVKNKTLYVYVDDYPAASVAIDDYEQGYVYIMGCTKNLEYRNIRVSRIKTAECISDIPYRAVPPGTPAEDIELPATLKIVSDGKTMDCPVSWSSPDYNGGTEGTYIFYAEPVGKYSHYWLSDSAKRIAASVSVGRFDSDITQKFALTATEELRNYFTNYYCETEKQITDTGAWRKTDVANTWSVTSDGVLVRSGSGKYSGGKKSAYGAAALYYNTPLTNFEVSFDYRHGKSGWRWFSVGFGAENMGDTYLNKGYIVYTEREGDLTVNGSTGGQSLNFSNPFPSSRIMEGYYDKVMAIWDGSDDWCHMRLRVTGKTLKVYIDDYEVWSCALSESYKGGYFYIISNSTDTSVKNLSIVNYDTENVTIASMQSAEDAGCAYQSIDKTKGESVKLPDEITVFDINGYSYNCDIKWNSPSEYRSGRLGTYMFTGVPVMPSSRFSNPDGISITAQVVISKVDFDPSVTVKYYFDTEDDLRDFTGYYTYNAGETDFAVTDWQNQWIIDNGQLSRINDDFKVQRGDRYNVYYKMARLTYNGALKGNYQIDIDYKKDSATWMWPMLSVSIKDKTKFGIIYDNNEFAQQRAGGTAVYLENEGYTNFWGNVDQSNLNGIQLRVMSTADKFVGYNSKEMHHMRLTFIDGVIRVWIDDYETNVAVRVPDEALGEYVGIMTNSNAAMFDNFAITKLSDDAEEGIRVPVDSIEIVTANQTPSSAEAVPPDVNVIPAVIVSVSAAALAAVSVLAFLKTNKKRRK